MICVMIMRQGRGPHVVLDVLEDRDLCQAQWPLNKAAGQLAGARRILARASLAASPGALAGPSAAPSADSRAISMSDTRWQRPDPDSIGLCMHMVRRHGALQGGRHRLAMVEEGFRVFSDPARQRCICNDIVRQEIMRWHT